VAGAIVYFPLRMLGLRLDPHGSAAYVALTFILNGLFTVGGLLCFFNALSRTTLPQYLHLPLTASLAAASLVLPYSTTLNAHGFCASLMCIGLYALVRSEDPNPPRAAVFCAGLAFAAAASADHGMLVFYGLFFLCILARPGARIRLLGYLVAGLLLIGATCAYYYVVGHSIRPFNVRPEFYVYPGSPWVTTGESTARLTGASRNSLPFATMYAFLMLFGKRGFLLYNSLSLLALYGIVRTAAGRARYWREALAVLLGTCALIAYYAFSSANFSGASYSIRWFVPLLPLWWFFGARALQNLPVWSPWKRCLVGCLCTLSVVYALAGAMNPWPEEWRGLSIPVSNVVDTLRRPLFVPF